MNCLNENINPETALSYENKTFQNENDLNEIKNEEKIEMKELEKVNATIKDEEDENQTNLLADLISNLKTKINLLWAKVYCFKNINLISNYINICLRFTQEN